MAHEALGCVVCGIPILDYEEGNPPPWLCDYRAIYQDQSPSRDGKITGVGRYDGSSVWSPPLHPEDHWNHETHATIDLCDTEVLSAEGSPRLLLHEACWQILRRTLIAKSITIQRLVEVCMFLLCPLQVSTVVWGHDYGGLWTLDLKSTYLWEENYRARDDESPLLEIISANPLDLNLNQVAPGHNPTVPALQKVSKDCFASLPWEILEQIGLLLNTKDALHLRLASVSFLPLFTSKTFWASRFSLENERGFVFDVPICKGYAEWIHLYRNSNPEKGDFALQNRHRIWGIARLVAQTMQSRRALNPRQSGAAHSDTSVYQVQDIQCRPYPSFLNPGSRNRRSLATRIVAIPRDVSEIGISVVEMGMCDYVTGIRFLSKTQESCECGYIFDSSERRLAAQDFRGLRVALSKSGIRAVQLILGDDEYSEWIGNPQEMVLCDRVFPSNAEKCVAITYDGFKLTGLDVGLPNLAQSIDTPSVVDSSGTHLKELWYPDIPSQRIHLNKESFVSPGNHTQPRIWMDIGGAQGAHLRSITGIRVQYLYGLHSIEIRYQNQSPTPEFRKMGSQPSSAVDPSPIFEMSGEQGERLVAVEVAVKGDQSPTLPQCLEYIRVSVLDKLTLYSQAKSMRVVYHKFWKAFLGRHSQSE